MSRTNHRRIEHNVRFDIRVYLNQMLTDLEHALGDKTPKLRAAVGNPADFRRLVSEFLSDTACMEGDVHHYAALRQVEACVSKLPSYGAATQAQRDQAALEKFLAAERACARANKRARFYSAHPRRLSPCVRQVINEAQLIIERCLGLVPDDEDLFAGCGFGPGLTFALNAEERHLAFKVAGDQTVTPDAWPLAKRVLARQFPNWLWHLAQGAAWHAPYRGYVVSQVSGNRIAFVPKTAKISRTIGIEPSLNVFMQKGVDEYLKRRLTRVNLNLRDQDYSISCMREYGTSIATIDLSSASDCVAREVVRWLFPADWFELLDVLRSKNYTLDKGKSWHEYEKFSSMGNATTFPVESLIFMALARGVARTVGLSDQAIHDMIRVYGDDIIVPWECAALLIEVLRLLGFRTNTDKTFVFGPFRETCGVDVLNGVDVRPVYLRSIPTRSWHVAGLFNRLLTNRVGFSFPLTLSYLHGLVENPLYGPAWFRQSAISPTSWAEWYAGKCYEGDAYFFAPHAHHEPVYVGRGQHVETVYALDRWGTVSRQKIQHKDAVSIRYMLFLLGIEGGKLVGEPRIGLVRHGLYRGAFPDLPWWPDVYAVPRQPSVRVLRRIAGEVVGESIHRNPGV